MIQKAKEIISTITFPVDEDTKSYLKLKWKELPAQLQTKQQIYGRNEEGCGATVGVMPKCDFNCKGCYLGKSANLTPTESIVNIKQQMLELRKYLGKWGNFQLTDGEVTLLPAESLIDILNYAREIELIPMIMTHGENFRENPDLLKKLMIEGGLQEISLHVDTTQKGRRSKLWQSPKNELELNSLRSEFAKLIRSVRQETGLPLRVATTITVTDFNIDDINELMPFFMENSDVFQLVSFLPLASVGRTRSELNQVSTKNVWKKVVNGVFKNDKSHDDQLWWMGHPDCNKFLTGLIFKNKGKQLYLPISSSVLKEEKILKKFFSTFGGITFRADKGLKKYARMLGMFIKAPLLLGFSIPKHFLSRLYNAGGMRLILSSIFNFRKVRRFTVVTHSFMDKDELQTDKGKERLESCSFKVFYQNELISMCEFNALGLRDKYYEELKMRAK